MAVVAQEERKLETAVSNSEVKRSRVKGSIHHAGGKSVWVRIAGKAKVIDARTLEFADGTQIPLLIVAPGLDQTAFADGKVYPCGHQAAEFLRQLIGETPVTCYLVQAQNKWMARVGDKNVEHEMIVNGWALAAHSSMNPDEIIARENKRGLWRGQFIDPEDWRAGKRISREAPQVLPRDKALAVLRDLDAIIRMDETLPGRSVVAVEFRPNVTKKARDGDLALLVNFPRLRKVALPSQPITDAGLANLHVLADLEELDLNWTKVSAPQVVRLIKDRKRLRRLELSGVDIRDDDLEALKNLTDLELLNLRSTLITDNGVARLASLGNLEVLNISTDRGRITDEALLALKPLTHLEDLDLDRTAITDAGLAHLKGMRNLRRLQFAHTAISDGGLEHLQGLANLCHLNCDSTRVTRVGRDKLGKALPLLDKGHPGVVRHYEDTRLVKVIGKVEVRDAHTLRFEDGTEVELNGGMDAPELGQQGKLGDASYPCGEKAAAFLKSLVGDREVTYYHESRSGTKLHGDCFVGETCIQIEMVRNGWAVSHHTGMDSWQMIASENKRGLWRGIFVPPEKWRRGERLPGEPLITELGSLRADHAESLKFSPGGKLLAAAYGDPAVKVWNALSREELFNGPHATGEARWCRAVAFAPQGGILASADDEGAVMLWDLDSHALVATLRGEAEDASGLAFTPNGKILFQGCRNGIQLWDLNTRTKRAFWKAPAKALTSLALKSDGATLASGSSDGTITFWDVATAKALRTLAGHAKQVKSLAFSPDGKTLVSGGWDKAVKLWDVASGQHRSTFRGHKGQVMAVAFAPDGRVLASGSRDGMVKLWDLAGQELTSLHGGGLSLAFSPDGTMLATGAGEGPVRLWTFGPTK
jgi:WD40 repeat protein